MGTELEMKVDLGGTDITVDELMGLKEGDVISLDQDATGEFDVALEGVPKFKGFYGIHHGTVAIQVTRKVNEEGVKNGG
jgi:flagellar motor switch protein FliM